MLVGSIPHPHKRASLRAASSFHGVFVLETSFHGLLDQYEGPVMTCLEGRSTFTEPVQRKRLGGKHNKINMIYIYYRCV